MSEDPVRLDFKLADGWRPVYCSLKAIAKSTEFHLKKEIRLNEQGVRAESKLEYGQ